MSKQEEIARTIIEQIKFGDKFALMAWGAKFFSVINESREFQGGLEMTVNGLKHKGWVRVN